MTTRRRPLPEIARPPAARKTRAVQADGVSVALRRRAARLAALLAKAYPDLTCPLDFRTPWECLAATILSAQCTDRKVNEVTPALFRAFDGPAAFARATPGEVEPYIQSIGLFRSKAKHLVGAGKAVVERFGGRVPETLDELVTLPGAGRKTANCVLANAFGQPGIMVDTHCIRVTGRLGLHSLHDPNKIEARLKALLPPKDWSAFSHRIIIHGRRCCAARSPRCGECPLAKTCAWPGKSA